MSDDSVGMAPRWADYVFRRDAAVDEILRAAGDLGPLVAVVGIGFDPRALHLLRRLADLGLPTKVIRVPLPGGAGHTASSESAAMNRDEADRLLAAFAREVVDVTPPDADRLAVGSRLSRELVESGAIAPDDAVIVDVSSLPTRIYFPIVGTLLALGERTQAGQLLVTVSENPFLDQLIRREGTEDPGTITGFNHGFNPDEPDRIRIWAPVIGEGASSQLQAIQELLQPNEIYPILPFPAREPRRADNLILEHRVLLFDTFEVGARNILYVQESNPFDTYRSLTGLHQRYRSLLATLGEPQLVVSTHASKTLAMGVCLAAYESRLPVVTGGASRYFLDEIPDPDWVKNTSSLSCLWLHGAPYR